MSKCKACGKEYDPRDSFGGYEEYCSKCSRIKADADYDDFLYEQFQAELEKEDPDFSDFYEFGDRYI